MVGEPVSRDCGLAVSLGPKARLISAWGIAPGIVTPNLSPAPTARFIAFDKHLLGGAMSCSGIWHGLSALILILTRYLGRWPQAGMKTRPWR